MRSEAGRGGRRNKMRGEVAVAVIVVLACALFLVPYASADVEISCSVYPEEGEFSSEFVYSITLTNPSSHEEVGMLGLIVGSDYTNVDISREWAVTHTDLEPGSSCVKSGRVRDKRIKIPANKSCTFKTRVYFTYSELQQGAFGDWTENPEHPKWDKAWYEGSFTPWPFGAKVVSEVRGKPIITQLKEIFREPHVEQNEAYKGLSFDYQVKVWANCEDSIELQVRNYSKTSYSRWDKHVLKNYTDVYTNETLTWPAVNLTPDNFDSEGHGLYKFVGNISESLPYSGPTIEERFKDPSVSYKKTINELLLFDYEVSVWIDQVKDSIKLEVYNYALHDWEQKGIRNYTTPGKYQKLKWESILLSLSSDYFDDDLRGKYRFVGKYSTLETIGPRIEEKFYDLLVTPTQGTNNRTFNYSVTVNANVSDKIELQVKNHTTDLWDSKKTRDYVTPNNKTLTWDNIQLKTHELNEFNDSMFRFEGIFKSNESEGPFYPLDLRWRNLSVTPNGGLYNDLFDYSIEVYSTKEIEVKLRVDYPHEGEGVISDNTMSYTRGDIGNWKPFCWSDTQPFVKEDEGDATYKFEFYYRGTMINETELYSRPSIGIAVFKDARLEPVIGTRETEFTYSVWVKAAKPDYITLTLYDSKGDNVAERRSKDKTTTEWKLFVFENVPFKVLPALGNASYEFLTGKNTKSSFDGPELIIEEFGALIVTPENGTNYTQFNFSIDFTTSKPRNVTLWARYDEGEWENVESKPVASKHETILFSNITPSKVFRSIAWKCKGIANESGITYTNWDIDLKWLNRSFSPKEERLWNDTFNFSVRLSANVPGDVVLMVKEEDSNVWMAVGNNSPYTDSPNPQTLTWESERIFDNPYEGNTSYNFTFYWGKTPYAATPSYGPKLFIPPNIIISSADVIPNDGVLYKFKAPIFSDNSNKRFNFSITMTAEKPTAVKLVLVDPAGNKHILNDDRKCEYTTPYRPSNCSWTMIELPSEGDVGEWEYTYTFYDTRFGGWNMSEERFKGPDIIAVFNSYTLDPEPPIPYGEECNVTVCMSGLEKMDVTLEAYNLILNRWESVGTESYEPAGEKCLRWAIDTFKVPFDKLRLKW